MTERSEILKGVAYAATAMFFLVLVSTFSKLVTAHHHPVESVFFRHFFAVLLMGGFALAFNRISDLKTTRYLPHILRATLGTLTMFLMFYSVDLVPLSVMISLFFTAPIFITILSWPLLREKVGLVRAGAIIVGFCGVLLIAQPWGSALSTLGIVLGIASAVSGAFVQVVLRWIGKTESAFQTTFYFAAIGLVIASVFIPFFWTMPQGITWLYMAAMGLFSTLGQLCLAQAYIHIKAIVVAPMNYTMLIWATLFDIVIWGVYPTPLIVLGAFIIVSSSLFIVWREQKQKKNV